MLLEQKVMCVVVYYRRVTVHYRCLGLVIIIQDEVILVHCSAIARRIPHCNAPQVPWIHSAWVEAHICSYNFGGCPNNAS